MTFNKHSDYEGKHAILSASRYHWIRYSDEKLEEFYRTQRAAERGTRLHALAKDLIELGVKLPRTHQTLNMYVNDAIGFKLTPEVVLLYSKNAFGCADAIGFKNNFLRIHDLKTGVSPASMDQLLIYAALFCLEYHVRPEALSGCELRIYQLDDILSINPESEKIRFVMDRIIHFDNALIDIQKEEGTYDVPKPRDPV